MHSTMNRIILPVIAIIFIFSACGGGGGSSSSLATENNTVTAVDGYIRDANLRDSSGQVGVYSLNGKYKFANSITYPLSLSGGFYEDTNASFDINMTAQSGNIISPITSFLENNATLRDKLVALGIANADTLSGLSIDYVSANNVELAKLAQLLYLVQKDSNLRDIFKTTLANSNPVSLVDFIFLIEGDVNSSMGVYSSSYRAFLAQIQVLGNDIGSYEGVLKTYKNNIGKIMQNGTNYGTVISPITQRVWLDRNLGASQICTDFNDTACFGDYYQWGRPHDGHQSALGGVNNSIAQTIIPTITHFIENLNSPNDWTSADSDGSLRIAYWSKTDGSSICPEGFRVPTFTELQVETNTTISDNISAFSNFLKIPSAGDHLYTNGSHYNQGTRAYLWSVGVLNGYAGNMLAGSTSNRYGYDRRGYGIAVRCIKD